MYLFPPSVNYQPRQEIQKLRAFPGRGLQCKSGAAGQAAEGGGGTPEMQGKCCE